MLSLAQTIKDLKNNIANILNIMAPKTYVDKKVADLVNGAPAQLDTLQELSKALNNDKDFGTTVNNAIARKLDSAGGTITGNLTVNGALTAKASTAGTADNAKYVEWGNIGNKPATATRWPAWDEVTGKPSLATRDGDTIYTNNWFRSRGNTGWYSESYGGGWYMEDTTWIRAYGNKNVYTAGTIRADGGFEGTLRGNVTGSAGSVAWGNVSGKPSTFTPSGHGHGWGDIAGAPATATRWPTWDEITGKPATFPSSGGGVASSVAWNNVTGKPSAFTPSSHTHAWGEIASKPRSIVTVESWNASTGVLKLKTV